MDTNDRKNPHTSGFGGAHVGMFGRARLLMAPEGDPPAGGGGTTTTGAGGTTTGGTPTPGESAPKAFTQEEVNRIAANAREEGRKAALKTAPPAPPPPSNGAGGDDEKLTLKQLAARVEEAEMRTTFEKGARKLGLQDDAADALFDIYKAQRPPNAGEWFERMGTVFGLGSKQTTTTTTTTAPTTEAPKPPPGAPRPPSNVDPLTTGGLVDIFNLPIDQVIRMGPQGLRAEQEKILAHAHASSGAPPLPKMGAQRKG